MKLTHDRTRTIFIDLVASTLIRGREAELLLAGTKPFAVFWPPERVPDSLVEAACARRVVHARHEVKARSPPEKGTQGKRIPRRKHPRKEHPRKEHPRKEHPRKENKEHGDDNPRSRSISSRSIDHDEEKFHELQSLVLDVLSGRRRADAATDKRLGQLLGYSDSDIKSFLVWKAQLKKSLF